MNEAIQSGSIAFKPRARLLKLIGAELISDDVVAITELVKNAHDADASSVVIEFKGVAGGQAEIVIRDDGDGMSLESLLRHWMEPAGTSKIGSEGRRTALGRRVLGEKGVGRFAADKLGARLELISRRSGERNEISAIFEWNRFEDETLMLTDVENRWEVRAPLEIKKHGTVLRISSLRSEWTERMFRRLSARLARLRSPFGGDSGFSIRIESDDFPEYSGELRADFLEKAPYRIEAVFDGRGVISTRFNGKRRSEHEWTDGRALSCGPVKVNLYAFDLETESIARIGPRMEVRAWLKEWSGVSAYRDGFRIWPYGEPHDDWLRLDQRRVNNPVVRLSNNQIVGFVEVGSDANPGLVDQTNREGLIHNPAFEDLRRLLYHVLQIIEADRQIIRHPDVENAARGNQAQKSAAGPSALDSAFDRLAAKASAPLAADVSRLRDRVREELTVREELHRRLEQGYAELAAVGQAALGISTSVKPVMEDIVAGCAGLIAVLEGNNRRAAISKVRGLLGAAQVASQRLGMLTPLDGGSVTSKRRVIDLLSEIEVARTGLTPLLEASGVRMLIDPGDDRVVRAEIRPENFHRAVFVLVSSMVAGLRHVRKPEIRLIVKGIEDWCELVFSDNGPGPTGSAGQAILAALNGHRGLVREATGLAAAKNIVENHGGRMELIKDRRRRGTSMRLVLPRKRSRATLTYS